MTTAIIQYDHVDDAWAAYVGTERYAKESNREDAIKKALEVDSISDVAAAYPYYVCGNCGHIWPYTGNSDRPTCPSCRAKQSEHLYGEWEERDSEPNWPDHDYDSNADYFIEEVL